jgi:hypothetical protein
MRLNPASNQRKAVRSSGEDEESFCKGLLDRRVTKNINRKVTRRVNKRATTRGITKTRNGIESTTAGLPEVTMRVMGRRTSAKSDGGEAILKESTLLIVEIN